MLSFYDGSHFLSLALQRPGSASFVKWVQNNKYSKINRVYVDALLPFKEVYEARNHDEKCREAYESGVGFKASSHYPRGPIVLSVMRAKTLARMKETVELAIDEFYTKWQENQPLRHQRKSRYYQDRLLRFHIDGLDVYALVQKASETVVAAICVAPLSELREGSVVRTSDDGQNYADDYSYKKLIESMVRGLKFQIPKVPNIPPGVEPTDCSLLDKRWPGLAFSSNGARVSLMQTAMQGDELTPWFNMGEASAVLPIGICESMTWCSDHAIYVKTNNYAEFVPNAMAHCLKWLKLPPAAEVQDPVQLFKDIKKTKPAGAIDGHDTAVGFGDHVYFRWVPAKGVPTDYPVRRSVTVKWRKPMDEAAGTRTFPMDIFFDMAKIVAPQKIALLPFSAYTLLHVKFDNGDYFSSSLQVAPFEIAQTTFATSSIMGSEASKALTWHHGFPEQREKPEDTIAFFKLACVTIRGSRAFVATSERISILPADLFSSSGVFDLEAAQKIAKAHMKEKMPVIQVMQDRPEYFEVADVFLDAPTPIPGSGVAARLLERVIPKDDSRYGLNGIGWNNYDGYGPTWGATDGSRLLVIRMVTPPPAVMKAKLIPRGIVDAKADIGISGNWCVSGNLAESIIDGEFPRWPSLIEDFQANPKSYVRWTWNVEDAITAITYVKEVALDHASTIRIDGDGKVSARSVDNGYKERKLPAALPCYTHKVLDNTHWTTVDSKEPRLFNIGMNASMTLDALKFAKATGAATITMWSSSPLAPVYFTQDNATPILYNIIMPIRLE